MSHREKEKRKRYDNLSDKEKERRLEVSREYYRRNREEINHKTNNYHSEIINMRKERGVCIYCDGEKETPKYSSCLKCRIKHREYSKRYYLKKHSQSKATSSKQTFK